MLSSINCVKYDIILFLLVLLVMFSIIDDEFQADK